MPKAVALVICAVSACHGPEDTIALREPPRCAQPGQGGWDDRFVLPGFGGEYVEVRAIARAPDGRVVVGGSFEHVVGAHVRSIAAWDGSAWAALGDGAPTHVRAIAFDRDGVLWAAGGPSPWESDGEQLARWDGAAWTTVLDAAAINVLVPFEGGLAVGGTFDAIGGIEAHGLAVWDGVEWRAVALDQESGVVAAVATDGGLCIAGRVRASSSGIDDHRGVACWHGVTWTPLGDQISGIEVLAQGPDGAWWLGGWFADFVDEYLTGGIARLDGDRWALVDGGVHDRGLWPVVGVRAIVFDGDEVIVGGKFQFVGAQRAPAIGLARWSPRLGWRAVRDVTGRIGSGSSEGDWYGVNGLLRDGDDLLVGGRFAAVGETFAPNFARLSTSLEVEPVIGDRSALGGGAEPLAIWNGDLVAAHVAAGSVPRAAVGVFDPNGTWRRIEGDPPVVDVDAAFVTSQGELTLVSDVVVRWDGAQWRARDEPGSDARPLLLDADDALYVANGRMLERWVGDARRELGDVGFDVTAITVLGGALVAGGLVWSEDAGDQPRMAIRHADRWDPVEVPLASGVADAVATSAHGVVVRSGTGELAAWDGATWTSLADEGVQAIAACDGGLYAGRWDYAGVRDGMRTLELHNGDAWRELDPPRPGSVYRLLATEEEVWASAGATGESSIGRWVLEP